jgi:Beta-lactamase class C and other penicillin binding proteins
MRPALPRALSALLCIALPALAHEPVATVRVAFDRDGVTATQVHGLADVRQQRAVTADDPVRIASISKLVLTMGVMRLVEEGSSTSMPMSRNTWAGSCATRSTRRCRSRCG